MVLIESEHSRKSTRVCLNRVSWVWLRRPKALSQVAFKREWKHTSPPAHKSHTEHRLIVSPHDCGGDFAVVWLFQDHELIKLNNSCILWHQLPAPREDCMTQAKDKQHVRYMIHKCTKGVTMPYYFVVKRSKVYICGAEYSSLNPALSLNTAPFTLMPKGL